MPDIRPLEIGDFKNALKIIGVKEDDNVEILYSIYSYTVEGIDDINSTNALGNLQGINHLELIAYCVGEFYYYTTNMNLEDKNRFKDDENLLVSISSIIADKYLSLSKFSYSEVSLISKFSPPISTLYVYINFMLNIMNTFAKQFSLYSDLFNKSISICKCTLDLLVRGFETEAFSCWRTLHECECALIVLTNNSVEVANAYLKHLQYGIAFKNLMPDKDKQTEIFTSMKEEMKLYDLKSKDIKKYIEYGWLYSVPGVKEDETFKLNFRDGLEKIAGLSSYNKRYEVSSEIVHGSPMLIYSNREYFHYITLLSTYESFFRLETIFASMFSKTASKEQVESYKKMRTVYYANLVTIHKKESEKFKLWQESRKK